MFAPVRGHRGPEDNDEHARRRGRLVAGARRLATWPEGASLRARSTALAGSVVGVAAAALLIADLVWRDWLPRSTIAAGGLAALALIAVWLFGSSGWRVALGVLSALGAILLAAGTALDLDQRLPDGPPPLGALVDCPGDAEGPWDGFVAPTRLSYTAVRDRPSLIGTIWRRYPTGCELAFDGYCIGEPKDHWLFHEQDPVWFSWADRHGYVPSADIAGGPSAGHVDRRDCAHDKPLPDPPQITAPGRRRLTGPIEIAAAAPGAIEVGFAVYYADSDAGLDLADWHQIGVDVQTGDGITARWDTRSVPGQGERGRPITVLAAPCLGLQFPAPDSVQRNYVAANGGGGVGRKSPPPDSIDHARRVACDAER
jgi:hypothetical protein